MFNRAKEGFVESTTEKSGFVGMRIGGGGKQPADFLPILEMVERLISSGKKIKEVAKMVGFQKSTIGSYQILFSLSSEARHFIAEKRKEGIFISMNIAREVVRSAEKDEQVSALKEIVAKRMTIGEVREFFDKKLLQLI